MHRWSGVERAELLCRHRRGNRARSGGLRTVPAVDHAFAMIGDFAAAWMPSVFVPLVGILGPAVAMALLFNLIEARD